MKKFFYIFLAAVILFFVFFLEYERPVNYGGSGKSLGELITPDIFEKEAKILFVGDMMFDRYIRQVTEEKGEDFIFSCGLKDFLKSFDLVVGNLEGPITDNLSVSMGTVPGGEGNYTFTFPPGTAELLAKNKIELVSLGNNHMLNFSRGGLLQTKKYLEEAEVGYFGLPAQAGDLDSVLRAEIGGINISFISYNEFGPEIPRQIAEKISEEKESGRKVFVYAHWGEEYVSPPDKVKKLARSFIDAGADLVVGSHPHIIQESEIYKDKPIYYSLGNFIFDQYWDESVSTGLALEVKIKNFDSVIEVTERKVRLLRDGRTCLTE